MAAKPWRLILGNAVHVNWGHIPASQQFVDDSAEADPFPLGHPKLGVVLLSGFWLTTEPGGLNSRAAGNPVDSINAIHERD
jgi:hypothetical protein